MLQSQSVGLRCHCGFVATFDGKAGPHSLHKNPKYQPGSVMAAHFQRGRMCVRHRMVQQPDDCFKTPDVIVDSGGDPRRHAQRSMVVVYCELI